MSGQLFQFQFEISKGLTIPADFLGLLLKICGEDDIQPIAIAPLELFGDWLMVDGGRISEGVAALLHRRNAAWKPLVLISPPKTSQMVSGNIRLTSVFLFATCCSIIFNVQKTTEIIYEMMTIGGAVQKYNITSDVVFRFIELLNGCRDSFLSPQKTPYKVYESLCEDTLHYMRKTNTWSSNLYEENDPQLLAKLLYKTFDALRNVENECIELEGSRGGLWIAFAFVWLRPTETEIFLADIRVYPETPTQNQKEELKSRLIIRFRQNPGHGSNKDAEGDWMISTWKAAAHVTEVIKIDNPTEQAGSNPLTPSPWKTARSQIELINHSLPIVNAIGHLAGALIQVVTECGRLWNEDFSADKSLLDICSLWYLKNYTTIMKQFGWSELNHGRQQNIAGLIKTKVEKGEYKQYESNTTTIESLIDDCFVDYEKIHQEPLLINCSDGDHEGYIIEHAVHLAAHAIISSIYRELPQHVTYWPLQPQLSIQHFKLIREMLLNHQLTSPQGKQWVGKGVSFESLRRRAIQTTIPSVMDIGPNDLAWAGDGYVVFSSALANQVWTDNGNGGRVVEDRLISLADPRLIGTIEVFPGCLQQKDVPGSYIRLSEDRKQMKLASRLIQASVPVNLFSEDGEFNGILENSAYDNSNIEVKYFLRKDDRTRTLFLTTYLEVRDESHHLLQSLSHFVPTSWHRSIDVTMFANHISENTSTQKQLEALARDWRTKGITMQWGRIGSTGPLLNARCILTTAGKMECRFFEAGSAHEDSKVFVRQRLVPLTHCVKVAMDICTDDTNWVIIA
jgi:hypothetical protein